MLLTCPACDTRYSINADSVPDAGRKVKCAKCGHRWTAEAKLTEPDPEPDPDPFDAIGATDFGSSAGDMPIVEGVLDVFTQPPASGGGARMVDDDGWDGTVWDGDQGWDPELEDRPRRPGRKRSRRGSKGPQSLLQPMLIGAAIALIATGFHYRTDVVRTFPATASLFAAIGYPVNLRGLDFADLNYRHVIENGVPVLAVNGAVANVTESPVFVPNLNFTLRGDRRQDVYQWTITPSQTMLEPGARLDFSTRLAAPPDTARDLVVRFVDPAPADAG